MKSSPVPDYFQTSVDEVASGSLLYDVFVLGQAIGAMLGEEFAAAPLTPSEYAVYSFFAESPDSTPTEMAKALGMPMQTASDWLTSLRRRRHVRTLRNPNDGRSYTVALTAEGRRVHRETNRIFEAVNRRYLRTLPIPERVLRGYLAEMIEAAAALRRADAAMPR